MVAGTKLIKLMGSFMLYRDARLADKNRGKEYMTQSSNHKYIIQLVPDWADPEMIADRRRTWEKAWANSCIHYADPL